jgi:hypothetical protein
MMTSPLHTMADVREVNAGMAESMRQLYPELAAFTRPDEFLSLLVEQVLPVLPGPPY